MTIIETTANNGVLADLLTAAMGIATSNDGVQQLAENMTEAEFVEHFAANGGRLGRELLTAAAATVEAGLLSLYEGGVAGLAARLAD